MIRKQLYSFKNALCGLKWVISTQRNFKIHLFLSFLALTGGILFRISYQEFLVVFVLVFFGLVLETINTAIEETINALHKEKSEEVKIAKDVSAAAVLIFAIGSFTIACIIFIPKIYQWLIFKF